MAGKPKQYKLTMYGCTGAVSAQGGCATEGKQIAQAGSRKFGMKRVLAAIRNGRLGGRVLDQTTGY